METMAAAAFADGYDSFRAVGDESFGNPHYQAGQPQE
jgi:hypothetical protein